jgi:hypothetical protein
MQNEIHKFLDFKVMFQIEPMVYFTFSMLLVFMVYPQIIWIMHLVSYIKENLYTINSPRIN